MDCQRFIDGLDDFLEGKLNGEDLLAAERHLEQCQRCRDLAALLDAEPPPGLAGAILERTSGSTCVSAHQRLCDHVDGVLDGLDDELVRAHLEGCAGCAALSRTLAVLKVDLPSLAEFQPDEQVVQAVLARTSAARPLAAGVVSRFDRWWSALLHRPRLAWEGAYLATFVLVLVFFMPWSPFSDVSRKTIAFVRGANGAGLDNPVRTIGEQLAEGVPSAWQASGGRVIAALQGVPQDIERLSQSAIDGIREGVRTVGGRDTSEQENTTNERSHETDRTEGDEP
jgi:anti-sigma factor RsiW